MPLHNKQKLIVLAILQMMLAPSVVTPFLLHGKNSHTSIQVRRIRRTSSRRRSFKSISTSMGAKYKTFEEMLEHHSDVPLLIDFYAPWCGPCKLMKDELKKIRPILDTMGPLINHTGTTIDKKKDCNVADASQSSNCIDINTENDNNSLKGVTINVSHKESSFVQTTSKPSGIPIFHVNANKFPQVGARNKIHGLPTLVLFLKGEEVWRFEGVMSGGDIVKSIYEELNKIGGLCDSKDEIAK